MGRGRGEGCGAATVCGTEWGVCGVASHVWGSPKCVSPEGVVGQYYMWTLMGCYGAALMYGSEWEVVGWPQCMSPMGRYQADRRGSQWQVMGQGVVWCCPTHESFGKFWSCSTSVGAMGFPAPQTSWIRVPWQWECPWQPTDPSSWWVLWGAVGLSQVYGVCQAL